MKRIALGFVCVVIAGIAASAQQGTDATKAIVKSYLEIQTALASDRFDDVKGPARTLSAQAAALGKEGVALAKAATAFESSADLKAARDAFGPVSDAVIARVRADGSKDVVADLRIAYCPMAKRSWLQREEQVRNPYYGTTMLTCGEVKPLSK